MSDSITPNPVRKTSPFTMLVGIIAAAATYAVADKLRRQAHERRTKSNAWRDYMINEGHIQRPEGTAQELEQEERAFRRTAGKRPNVRD